MNRLVAAAAVVLLVTTACGGSTKGGSQPVGSTTTRATEPVAHGTIDVADQTTNGTKLTIAAVTIADAPNGGWVVLHIDASGQPGPVMGKVHIPPGASQNVVAPFDTKQKTGPFWPMLHVDDHQPNVYEFGTVPGADAPVTSGGDIVMKRITMTVK